LVKPYFFQPLNHLPLQGKRKLTPLDPFWDLQLWKTGGRFCIKTQCNEHADSVTQAWSSSLQSTIEHFRLANVLPRCSLQSMCDFVHWQKSVDPNSKSSTTSRHGIANRSKSLEKSATFLCMSIFKCRGAIIFHDS
jgi:hypothetical protein